MKRYPLFLDIEARKIPVVGGGVNALRKARLLIAAHARPVIIDRSIEPMIDDELGAKADYVRRDPVPADFADAPIVVIAVEDADAAARYASMAKARGALVNVVDQPKLCDFTTPSIVDRGRLTIAISTDGAAPVYGRTLRARIEAETPARAGELMDFVDGYRDAVKARFPEAARRAFWENVLNGSVAARFLAGDEKGARDEMMAALNGDDRREGVVHIVGAGPGDPELLTLKALRLIQQADVLLYDRLVSDDILAMARRDADRIFVGKAKANHAVPQGEIEQRMISLAKAGKFVVRLKGGDPFVFGRGGEELDAVRAAGLSAFVTPGVTAATGCAAATAMPLTHRDYAQAVTFVTGHAKDDNEPDLDWSALAAIKNTLVVYMGVGKAEIITKRMIENGRAATTPVAVIENGTRENEISVKGALRDLPTLIAAAGIKGPALLVIGEVAALGDAQTISSLVKTERIAA